MTPPDRPAGNAFATVDFDKPGRQAGFVMFPHSPHDDAWGVTRLPIGIIANGTGPTVILEGGNHGDEYEGSITVSELIRDLDPARVNGRLILMPANNVHACTAARRTSPVDGVNLNRAFPGDPRGTITQQIAAYLTDHIFPMGDAFLDLHSGGSSLQILPSAIIEPVEDARHYARNVAAVRAFGAPNTVVIGNLGDPRTATATACRAGLTTVGTEMRGGGTVSLDALDICRRGVRNVLAHLGVIERAGTHHRAEATSSICRALRPMSMPRTTACSSRFTSLAPRFRQASPPDASIAPGTLPFARSHSATRWTGSFLAGGIWGGLHRETACWSSPLPPRVCPQA